ncbi:MAG TPA: hypothetical protein VMT72_03495, partial [Pseudolabrys sp.]|nr:hypothetical protein [Pseudolabrys sp.]
LTAEVAAIGDGIELGPGADMPGPPIRSLRRGGGEPRGPHGEPERPGGLEIDHKPGRRLQRLDLPIRTVGEPIEQDSRLRRYERIDARSIRNETVTGYP